MPSKMLHTEIPPLLVNAVEAYSVWRVCLIPILEAFNRLLLGDNEVWGQIFSSALLQPKMVLPAKFHRNQPSHFASRSRRFGRQT